MILADRGYKVENFVLTPLKKHLLIGDNGTQEQREYMKAHSTARMQVENAFGIWKRKFPIVGGVMRNAKIDNLQLLIGSSLTLYNISRDLAIQRGIEDKEEDGEEEMQEELYADALEQISIPEDQFDEQDRSAIRRKVVVNLFQAEHNDAFAHDQ